MLSANLIHAWCTGIMHSLPYKTSKVEQVSRAQAREESKQMAQTAAGKRVRSQSSWLGSGSAHAVSGVSKAIMPPDPTRQAVLRVVQRSLASAEPHGATTARRC